MKPSPFAWSAPASVAEALAVLARVGGDGKVLAGGQSLLPILNMRLAAPAHLVDINRLAELAYVRATEGAVVVGALARHAAVERDGPAYDVQPLLRQALGLVAHPVIRNRGVSEQQCLSFYSPYGCSKGTADQYVLDYANTFGLPAASCSKPTSPSDARCAPVWPRASAVPSSKGAGLSSESFR